MIATENHDRIHPGIFRHSRSLLRRVCGSGRIPVWRTLAQFAAQEIVIATGPFAGRKFRLDRQPFARHLYEEIDRDYWKEIAITGPSQSGKTLVSFVIPILWHLFERQEDVIVMAPNDDICLEKWQRDLEPIIQRTRYAGLLPDEGKGARGGWSGFTQFKNGRFLKWMTAGGGDKRRAHYTARVIFMTEVDGMASSDSTSLEADKVKQVEARGNAYAEQKIIYKECTVSVPTGHIWHRYTTGTRSRLMLRCPHCKKHVHLEREDFRGWQDAANEIEARERATFFCHACGEQWTDIDRAAANDDAVLLHEGQTIDAEGTVGGEVKKTLTFGFRWSAVNNLLESSANLGAQEWGALQEPNRDNAEKKMLQFNWAIPYDDPNFTLARLEPKEVARRQSNWTRGFVPAEASHLTVGIDVHKRLLYWTVLAMLNDGRKHIVDYGRTEVPSDELGEDLGITTALRDMRDRIESGWVGERGTNVIPAEIWIDSGNWSKTIVDFIQDGQTDATRYRPTIGRGFGQQKLQYYNRPKKTGSVVKYIGEEFHASYNPTYGLYLIEFNSDYWKSALHSGLKCDMQSPHRITLFQAAPQEHTSFVAHITAEHQEERFQPERGNVTVWRAHSRNNHWFDSTVLSLVSACAIKEGREENVQSSSSVQASSQQQARDENGGPIAPTFRLEPFYG